MDSGLRKLSILAKLSRHKKITAAEIYQQFLDEGEPVSLRTIQRDLVELSRPFPVCGEDSKPIGWSIKKDAELTLPELDLTTAITFVMAGKYLDNLLPPTMLERLVPYTRTAKQYLLAENKNASSQWPKKVVVHTKGQPLMSPNITADTIEAIYGAVLSEKCLLLTYQSLKSATEQEFVFHPYGIVVRSERTYLIGHYTGYRDIRQLSLSRVIKAERLHQPAEVDPTFSLSQFVETGAMGIVRSAEKIEITLWITEVLATLLTETPLSENQSIEPKGDDYVVTACVDDTDELRHWILSMSNHATVLAPQSLRQEIKETLITSCSYYEDEL